MLQMNTVCVLLTQNRQEPWMFQLFLDPLTPCLVSHMKVISSALAQAHKLDLSLEVRMDGSQLINSLVHEILIIH